MNLESALKELEHECWCDYNHEHVDEYGNWISDNEKINEQEAKTMTNYEKAMELLKNGKAEKHYTYNDTGVVCIDLGGDLGGYAAPDKEFIEVVRNATLVWYGNITDDLTKVTGTRNNVEAVIV